MGHAGSSPMKEIDSYNSFIKKSERAQLNDLMIELNHLGKNQESKSKPNQWQGMIKIRAEMTDIETQKTV